MKTIQSYICFRKEQPNENSLIVENKFNPISHRPCVYYGTKLNVLIAYFEEKSYSLHLFIIFNFLKRNKTRATACCLLFQLNIFFSSLKLDIQSLNIFSSEKRLDI